MVVTTIGELKQSMSAESWARWREVCSQRDGYDPDECHADEEVAMSRIDVIQFMVRPGNPDKKRD